MNTHKMKKILLLIAFISISLELYAGGYRVSLQGVRQAAMAHTSAHTRDASVAFFNPAGIAFIPEKLSVTAGGFGVLSYVDFQDTRTFETAKTDNPIGTPFYLGVAYKVTDKFSAGLSVTTPFGNSVKWNKDWSGRDLITEIQLKSFFFQPTIAYRFNDWFSVGFGYIYVIGGVKLQKAITSVNGNMTIKDNYATGQGFNIGMYFKPTDKLDVSIAYRTNIDVDVVKGKADFDIPQSLIGSSTFPTAHDKVNVSLPLVSEFTLGATYRVTPQWSVSADFNGHGWERYKNLIFDFEQNQIGNTPTDPTISSTPKEYKNSYSYRIGTEYMATDRLALRLGYYYDQSPVSKEYWNPETPSADNNVFSTGIGYKFGKGFYVDVFGNYLKGSPRNIENTTIANFVGQVKTHSFMFGLGLTWNAF